MVTFRRVLCPIDFSETSERALAYAAAFAEWHRARLAVMHVAPTFEASVAPPIRYDGAADVVFPVLRDEVLEALHRAAKTAGASASRVEAVAESGAIVPAIVGRAITWPADLLVIGTHGRGGFDRLVLGSVAERVMHKAPCPVLTVPVLTVPVLTVPPSAPAPSTWPVSIHRILCPVDFSPSSAQAVGFALDLARQTKAAVTFLAVIEWPTGGEPRTHAHFAVPEYQRLLLAATRDRLVALAPAQGGVQIAHTVVAGHPKAEILKYAREHHADLIVMGAQGRDGVELALLGSTTERVVREATCPVLTVRGSPTTLS